MAALFAPRANEYWLSASNVDESELPYCDLPGYAWVDLLRRLAKDPFLIGVLASYWNQQDGQHEATAPDGLYPEPQIHRAHAHLGDDR